MLLRMEGITKRFPGVVALEGVTIAVAAGRVHALVGENGAGKSTLIKILAGAYTPDAGTIVVDGQAYDKLSPALAHALGIHIIYQEFNLIPSMTVAENVFLGQEMHRGPLLARRAMRRAAGDLLERVGARFAPDVEVGRLSVTEQQLVEIAKGLVGGARVMVLDEPSAVLAGDELRHLFGAIRTLVEQGVGVIYISHRLEEVFQIAQDVTVLKDGRNVALHPVSEVSQGVLISEMVGRELQDVFPPPTATPGDVVLEVQGLNAGAFVRDAGFQLRAGEILGVAGMTGSGRTTLARALFGAVPIEAGHIRLDGKQLHLRRPVDAMAAGIAFVPEDRKREGIMPDVDVTRNAALALLRGQQLLGPLNRTQEMGAGNWVIEHLQIRPSDPRANITNLSGGNQQKVILGRWLLTAPRVVVLDEPTRGIDVGAREEIYHLIRDLTSRGTAVLMVSSDLLEIIGMSDRVLVMRDGLIAGELTGQAISEDRIMELAVASPVEAVA
jgi:ribose transport system ATP-binding protein